MARECQCADDLPYTHREIDTWLPGLRRWAGDTDWRVREWTAWRWRMGVGAVDINNMMRTIHAGQDPTGLRLPRGKAWDALGDLLGTDSHPAVRQHVLHEPDPRARDGSQKDVDAAEAVVGSGDPALIAELPWMQRRLAASGRFGPAPRVLLDDPICAIRLDALRHLADEQRTASLLPWMGDDPCRWVRAAIRDLDDSAPTHGTPPPPALPTPQPDVEEEDEPQERLENEGQFEGYKEVNGSFNIGCNWCGAQDGGYTEDVFDRFEQTHHCEVVPLDGRHINAVAKQVGQELGLPDFRFALSSAHLGRINTQWLQVKPMTLPSAYFRSDAFRSLLALLGAEADRNRWTIGLHFTPRAAAELQDLLIDFDFTPHDRRTGHRYSDTGQLYLRRPSTLTNRRPPAPTPPPPRPDPQAALATLVSESPQACLAIDPDGRVLAANAEAQRQVGPIEAGVHIWDTPALSALEQLHHAWAVLPVRDPVPSTTISTNDGANTRVALSELPSRAMHQGALVTIGDDPLPWLSAHDGKTGLLSRGALLQILEERPEPFTGGVIVWLEIDRLEAFRELHGPGVEGRLIAQVAAALTTHLPTGGIAARLGHDEFLMLLPGVAPPDAARMLDRQMAEIRAPLLAPTGPARGSVSAGVAGLTGWPSLDEALIRVSAAATRAQTEGGDRYVIDTQGGR